MLLNIHTLLSVEMKNISKMWALNKIVSHIKGKKTHIFRYVFCEKTN